MQVCLVVNYVSNALSLLFGVVYYKRQLKKKIYKFFSRIFKVMSKLSLCPSNIEKLL